MLEKPFMVRMAIRQELESLYYLMHWFQSSSVSLKHGSYCIQLSSGHMESLSNLSFIMRIAFRLFQKPSGNMVNNVYDYFGLF